MRKGSYLRMSRESRREFTLFITKVDATYYEASRRIPEEFRRGGRGLSETLNPRREKES